MGGINGGAFSAVDEEASNFHENDEVISSQAKVKAGNNLNVHNFLLEQKKAFFNLKSNSVSFQNNDWMYLSRKYNFINFNL